LKKIQSGGVVLVLALLLVSVALIHSSAADSSQVYEGPGWRLEISENPLLNASTGQPYRSAGAAIAARDPGYWASISDTLRAEYEAVPAVQRQASLSLSPTAEQQERINALAGIEMSEAQFLSFVFPDLWEVVPGWQKEIWAGQPHRGSGSSSLSAGSLLSGPPTGSVAGTLQRESSMPSDPFTHGGLSGNSFPAAVGDQTNPFTGFNPISATTAFAMGPGSPLLSTGDYSIPGDYPAPGRYGADKSIFPGQSSATGSTGSFAPILSNQWNSGFGYSDRISMAGNIAGFGFLSPIRASERPGSTPF